MPRAYSAAPLALLLIALAASVALAEAEPAEEAAPTPDEEAEVIEVQGQRTGPDQQDAAVAVSSFGQHELDYLGVSDISGLQQNVPSLHVGTSGTDAVITLRGVGVNNLSLSGEHGVLVHQDGIALGRASGALNAFYDVSAVNVLRGPQGTQGGKHTTGGRIEILSTPPGPAFEARTDIQVGTYDRLAWQGALNAPILGDDLMLRLTGRYEGRDGYQRGRGEKWLSHFHTGSFGEGDGWDDADDYLVRGQLRSLVGDGFDILLLGQHSVRGGNGPGRHLLGILSTGDPRVSDRDYRGYQDVAQTLLTMKVVQDFSVQRIGALQWRGQVGYARSVEGASYDDDLRRFNSSIVYSFVEADQISFEASLRTIESRPVDWRIGFFYWQETVEVATFRDVRGPSSAGDSGVSNGLETDSLAGFAELDFWASDTVRLGVGFRWSEDLKDVTSQSVGFEPSSGIIPRSSSAPMLAVEHGWEALTYKALLEWEVTDNSMLTINVTTGYKSGGFPIGRLCAQLGKCPIYRAEKVNQYEVTSKNDFFDGRWRLNLTLFWTDFSPYQICYVLGTQDICADNGTALTRGFELETSLNPTPELTLVGNFDILDGRIDNFRLIDPSERSRLGPGIRNPLTDVAQDLSGNRLPRSPKYNLSVLVRYDFALPGGTLTPQIQYQYQSKTKFRVWDASDFDQSPTTVVNLRLSWASQSSRWKMTAFIDNLGDVDKGNYAEFTNSGRTTATYQPPRVAGLRFDLSY